MADARTLLEDAIEKASPRSLESALFNMAHAYALAAAASLREQSTTGNADFAGPAIMCQSFAVELLLKFFLATDHPSAATPEDLTKAGVKLRHHKYSELFDQLAQGTKQKLADSLAHSVGNALTVDEFRSSLIEQGDDPFIYWRYIYETKNISHFDLAKFTLLTNAIGRAAEVARQAAAGTRSPL